ncbi:LADA_0H10880g1_1 [Lachancea dasiensis]|uniref:2-dehydropantoate 2-reductase n=1 Tax=Lachancea dasiensis TaxID=1072105 RepID=A0A1G4K396_9SACH|nr:LADA_0H10880g1_1 [Lachancea dasiensis]
MAATQPRVCILGFGSIGVLLASHLQQNAQVTVIPLLRSEKRLEDLIAHRKTANVKSLFLDQQPIRETIFDAATCPELIPNDWKIDNLIITTKTYQTKDALKPYMKYLHPRTNIMLVQNGLGVFEVLNEEIFVEWKPNLFQGVISHGIFNTGGFSFSHAGFGNLKVARLPSQDPGSIVQSNQLISSDRSGNELIRIMNDSNFAAGLDVQHLTYQEMLLGQLEKLIVNCCMNSVTSIVDCINGELRDIGAPIFDAIISESLTVLQTAYKPLFDYKPSSRDFPSLDVLGVLDRKRLLAFVLNIGCVVNGSNSTSMRQDVVNLRDTEIEYINGYIVRLCDKLALGRESCKTNETIETLVKLRLGLNRYRDEHGDKRVKH